ncbi:gliding motility-associated C-terminal domain-containing protein, partial [Bizionia myxarmorum]
NIALPEFDTITPTSAPADCYAGIVLPTLPSVTDACGNVLTPTGPVESSTPSCEGAVTYTWTYTDCAGNTQDYVHTANITLPEFDTITATSAPADCYAGIVLPTLPSVTDACGNVLTPTGPVESSTPSCEGAVTYTWTYTDCAGNTQDYVHTANIALPEFDAIAATSAPADCYANIILPTLPSVTDACGNVLTPTGPVESSTPSCEGAVTYTWTYTDCAGNTQDYVHTANITLPEFDTITATSAPADCYAGIVLPTLPSVTDACGNVLIPTGPVESSAPTCEGAVTYTWTYTDCAGNTQDYVHTANIALPEFDTITPTSAPADCYAGIVLPTLPSVTDACGNVLTPTGPVESSTPSCEGAVTYTWTYTDCAGNTQDYVHTANIALPEFDAIAATSAPADCYANIILPTLPSVSDACGNLLTPTGPVESPTPSCEGAVTYTWTYTDCAGNTQDYVHTANIEFTAFTLPSNSGSAITCIDEAQAVPTPPSVVDSCGNTIIPTGPSVSADPTCLGDKTYTWTYTDCAGNTGEWVYTYSLNDNIDPVLTVEASNTEIQCDGSGNNGAIQDWLDTNGGATATDNCGTVTWTNNYGGATSDCSNPIEVIFTATDACGNFVTTTATYAIQDTVNPIITAGAANASFECDGSGNTTDLNDWLLTNGGATATDDCSSVSWSNNFTSLSDECGQTGSATVIFTATDGCGNAITTSATFTIVDTTNPVITTDAADYTTECDGLGNETELNDWLNSNGGASSTDACSDIVWDHNYKGFLTITCGTTGYTIVDFKATDACGNESFTTATFTIVDTIAPIAPAAPADVTVACISELPTNMDLTAVDNCEGTIIASPIDTTDNTDPCNVIVIRTWTFTDACNNSSSVSQTITVSDTIAPVAPAAPADVTVTCISELPTNLDLTAVDNCLGDIIASPIDTTNNTDPCNVIVTRTWTFTDSCNNSSSVSQTITVSDTIAPVAPAAPADVTVACISELPTNLDLTAVDNCAGDIIASPIDTTNDTDPCNVIVTRTWTFTDACNNSSSVSQTITVSDTIAPVAPAAPADVTVACISELPTNLDLTAVDNCLGNIIVSPVDSTDNSDPCNVIVTRTWTFTDACNNSSSVSQTITVSDTIAPVAPAAPADVTVACISELPTNLDLTAVDNCLGNITVSPVDSTDNSDPCNVIVTRTWTFTDSCNNSSSVSQTITVSDTVAPVAPAPPTDITVACISELPTNLDLTAVDNCLGDIVASPVDSTDSTNPCNVIVTRTWTFTDGCNNSTSISQIITVIDNVAPTVTNDLSDIFVNCAEIPQVPVLVFNDCSNEITILSFVETNTSDGSETDYEIIWNWTVADACGNEGQFSQAVYVTNENTIIDLTDDRCIDDGLVDLFDYYSGADTSGTWIAVSTNATLDGNFFNPSNIELGDYVFSYTIMDNGCSSTTRVTINVNDDCVVLAPEPCDRESIVISTAITPNGDQWNEYFEIQGAENCGYSYDVQIFNRWGAIIYKATNYQNNWNGFAHKSSIGGADTVPNGTYYYIINIKNSGFKPVTGYFYVGTK